MWVKRRVLQRGTVIGAPGLIIWDWLVLASNS